MHGIEIFESPNLNITAKLILYQVKIQKPKLGISKMTKSNINTLREWLLQHENKYNYNFLYNLGHILICWIFNYKAKKENLCDLTHN